MASAQNAPGANCEYKFYVSLTLGSSNRTIPVNHHRMVLIIT